jgi:hypothetical protein
MQIISPDSNPIGILTAYIAKKTAIYTSRSGVNAVNIIDLTTNHEIARMT